MAFSADSRTSVTDPLQIATVNAGDGMGSVGLTFCPGKKQVGAFTGTWDRDLAVDVQAIADWGAGILVTLIEPAEMIGLNVGGLGDEVGSRHMEWLHLPIPDVSVPEANFESRWSSVGPSLRSRLRAGFNVLVHCKGGLGRAGTIASRILIDAGWEPARALAAVREVRPGAVETMAQEDYVLACRPVPEMHQHSNDYENRAVGALLGLAVGDAVGTTLEFSARDRSPPLADMIGGGPFDLQQGQWTDDTAMALALAESLAADRDLDEHDLMARFLAWYRRGEYSCTGNCFDIGGTTRSALEQFSRSGNPIAGATGVFSAGNGSLMRLAPVAIAHWRDRALLGSGLIG